MRGLSIATSIVIAMAALPAMAQTLDPATGARPGHEPGVGESLPRSDTASNIAPSSTRSIIAPTLPGSGLADAASVHDYLAAARTALLAGHTGQAQQALEMAETRALGNAIFSTDVSPAPAIVPSTPLVTQIHDARQAVGARDNAQAIRLIDLALAG